MRVVAKAAISPPAALLGKRRFKRAAASFGFPLRIHIGAGTVILPSWLNTDVGWRSRLYLDITSPWPVPSHSTSHIYADNVIEHFPLEIARRILRHAFDALQPGGTIRLVTPGVDRIARIYLDDAATAERHLEFWRTTFGAQASHRVDLLRLTFNEFGHHRGYLYDWDALASELERAGYTQIRELKSGESDSPVLRGLESRTKEVEAATMLVVEALKAVG